MTRVPFIGGPADGEVWEVGDPPSLSVVVAEFVPIEVPDLASRFVPVVPGIRETVYRLHRRDGGGFWYLAPDVHAGSPGGGTVFHAGGVVTAYGGGGGGSSVTAGAYAVPGGAAGGSGVTVTGSPGVQRPAGEPGGDACRSYGAGPLIL